MCLAIPMEIVEITSASTAVADAGGIRRLVNTSLIEAPVVGDFLIVHAGFAISRLDREEADFRIRTIAALARQTRQREHSA